MPCRIEFFQRTVAFCPRHCVATKTARQFNQATLNPPIFGVRSFEAILQQTV
jgi:hypothetical protein